MIGPQFPNRFLVGGRALYAGLFLFSQALLCVQFAHNDLRGPELVVLSSPLLSAILLLIPFPPIHVHNECIFVGKQPRAPALDAPSSSDQCHNQIVCTVWSRVPRQARVPPRNQPQHTESNRTGSRGAYGGTRAVCELSHQIQHLHTINHTLSR